MAMKPEYFEETNSEDIILARKIRLMSEEEKKDEEKKLDRLKRAKIKEIVQKIKAGDNFFHNITKIRDKIKDKRKELYLGKTLVSFRTLDMCVVFLRMFQSDLQKEILADANNPSYNYLLNLNTKIAPFIDDLRWEHMHSVRHFYVVETLFVLGISTINMFIEKSYNYRNLKENIINKQSLSNPVWILPLLLILLLQIILSVVSVVFLEKLISRYTFFKRSKKIEINFVFFNFFMILNNIIVVFYGFLWGAHEMSKEVLEDRKYYFNFFINFQWIKNSLIIIFIPLIQRLLGDYLIKWHLLPRLKRCQRKMKKNQAASRESQGENPSKANDSEVQNLPQDLEIVPEERKEDEAPESPLKRSHLSGQFDDSDLQVDGFSSNESSEEDEENEEAASFNSDKYHRKKPTHDFGLNSSYLIQVAFFTGFYMSFASPALLLITFVGVWLNSKFESRLLRNVYDKTKYISISILFITLRWSFIAFCVGIVLSVANSRIYLAIINYKSNEDFVQISKVTSFQNMVGYCNVTISIIFFFQMRTGKIMFRVLNSINSLKNKFGGSFFKHEFETVNYKTQNPFYSF